MYIKYNVLYNQLTFTYSTKFTLNDIYINVNIHSTLVTLYFKTWFGLNIRMVFMSVSCFISVFHFLFCFQTTDKNKPQRLLLRYHKHFSGKLMKQRFVWHTRPWTLCSRTSWCMRYEHESNLQPNPVALSTCKRSV